MDLHQIEYIIAIEEEQSISKAAEKLFMTQSALNQQLLRLERELGLPLFERKKRVMEPTLAGKIYLTTAHQMVNMKHDAYKMIHDICEEKAGEIFVSYTPEQGAIMFSSIYSDFHRKYPNITFRISEARVPKMEQMVLHRDITIAFMTYANGHRHPDLIYRNLREESIVLGLPASHPLAALAGERSYETLPPIDLRLLKEESFTLSSKETRTRQMIDESFAVAGYQPNILFESAGSRTLFSIPANQVGPAFFPASYIDPAAPVVYFTVRPNMTWTQCICYRKDTYLTKAEQYFIQLAIQESKKTK